MTMGAGPFDSSEEANFLEALARLFAEKSARPIPTPPTGAWMIPIDLVETADHLVVIAAVPGVPEEELQVTATEKTLTIEGKARDLADESEARHWTWYLDEIPRGEFARTIDLPVEVNPAAARATLRDGLLRLDLPLAETPHRLTVQVGREGRR
jgi:HSP20 family protein